MISVTPTLALDDDEVVVSFIRSSGPGGQNVNKVATAVQLRFDVAGSPSLDEGTRARLTKLAGKRLTSEGVIVITANRHRTQEMNRKDAVERLVELIAAAAVVPRRRVKTKVSRTQRKARLADKRQRGDVKAKRRMGARDWD